jgi:8-oxo-dGTP pyrophosphatase MutT (NUDIX family)
MKILRRLPVSGPGFLTLTRLLVRNQYEDGALSPIYRFEMVERRGIDSVAMIPYFRRQAEILVVVKAGFRPALYLRGRRKAPGEGLRPRPFTIEAVAGSLEPGESSEAKIRKRAARELLEETGYVARGEDFISLGAGFFPSHGQCTEKVHLLAVALAGKRRVPARGDGSVNEANAWSLVLEGKDLLHRCRGGEVEDPKLEIGVGRLLGLLARIRRRG